MPANSAMPLLFGHCAEGEMTVPGNERAGSFWGSPFSFVPSFWTARFLCKASRTQPVASSTGVGHSIPLVGGDRPQANRLRKKRESGTPGRVPPCLSRAYPRFGRGGKEAVGCRQAPIFRHFFFTPVGIKTQRAGAKKRASIPEPEGHTARGLTAGYPRFSPN